MLPPPSDAERLGRLIQQRIIVRERAKLQVRFLRELAKTPLAELIVFRDAAALHGVYLHGRWSEDLDFVASQQTKDGFIATAQSCGLPVEMGSHNVPIYTRRNRLYGVIAISIDVVARPTRCLFAEERLFRSIFGETVGVRVHPMSAILAQKLYRLQERQEEVDFYDLWLGLSRFPELRQETAEMVSVVKESSGINTKLALLHLHGLRETWGTVLSLVASCYPPFEQIWSDLTDWLPYFELGRPA